MCEQGAKAVGRIVDLDAGHERQVIHTPGAPAAVGPYSQAIRAGTSVFTAGQIGLDPATGRLVEGGVAAEAERAIANLRAVLEAAGSSLTQVVKATVYLADMADFGALNDVYGHHFTDAPPARMVVAVHALPLGARIAIEAIAQADA
jgi:2-iminobutanoate/2-iminopropanoate deaminase